MDEKQAQNCVDVMPLLRGKRFPKRQWCGCAAHVMAVAKGVGLHPLADGEEGVVPDKKPFRQAFGVGHLRIAFVNDDAADGQEGNAVCALLTERIQAAGHSHLLPDNQ